MAPDPEFDAMVETCIQAGKAVMARGTPELQIVMKTFLRLLGEEIARRERAAAAKPSV